MPTNWYMYFVAALIPVIVAFAWYGPLFNKAWMASNGFTKEDLEGTNKPMIMIFFYIFNVFIAFALGGIVIHQSGVAQTMIPDIFESGSVAQNEFIRLMETYGDRYRTWGHGALHGGVIAILIALPVIAINGLWEKKSWKYIWIHTGYWIVSMTLMGALLCKTLMYATPS